MENKIIASVEKLINEVTKHGILTEGNVQTNAKGVKYRYDFVKLKYNHTAYWLKLLFETAAKDATGSKSYPNQFHYNNYSIHFDRAVYKSERDRKISFSKLVILG